MIRAYAVLVTRLHWLVLAGIGFGVWAAATHLPALGGGSTGSLTLSDVADPDLPAVAAQAEALNRFGLPLLSRVALVQHDPSR